MTGCEMCGKDVATIPVLIEKVELNVCEKCAAFGKAIRKPRLAPAMDIKKTHSPAKTPIEEKIQTIREDYSKIIREKREKLGLKQEEFAKFLSERESLVHKMESGTYKPSIDTARKIEKLLNVSLIEEKTIEPHHMKAKNETFTIGDIIKVK